MVHDVAGWNDWNIVRGVKQRREWPALTWLPAMTTLQALIVIILGLVVAGLLPRYEAGAGFGLDFGNLAVALGLTIAALSPKKPSRRERRRRAAAEQARQ